MDDSPEHRLRATFAQRLQIERRNAGLTQEELAASIGRSVDLVSRLERATSSPSMETIALLAEALNTSPASLFAHGGHVRKRRTELDELIELVLSAPPSSAKRLRQVIKAFLK